MPVSKPGLHRSASLLVLLFFFGSALAVPESCREPHAVNGPFLTQLWQDFETLSSDTMQGRKAGTKGAELARDYIVTQFQNAGLIPLNDRPSNNFDASGWLHLFQLRRSGTGKQGANVVGLVKGTQSPEKYLVLTAHYDHLGTKSFHIFNGANDNASGVAGLIYIARQLSVKKPAHSVVFVATDNEEAGLYGAKAFVEQQVLNKSHILLNVNLDMIAQPGREWRLYVSGTRSQSWLKPPVDEMIAEAPVCVKKGMDTSSWNYNHRYRIDWRRASDHWEFAKQDIPWLFLAVKDYRYYHSPRDTIDKIPQHFYFGTVHSSFLLITSLDRYFLTHI